MDGVASRQDAKRRKDHFRFKAWLFLRNEKKIKEIHNMANNTNVLSGEKPCNNELMRGVKRVQGTAAREPGQRERTADSGTGTASSVNSRNTLPPLFGTAAEEPNQGARTPDSGAGGCASLEGRGTMEQK